MQNRQLFTGNVLGHWLAFFLGGGVFQEFIFLNRKLQSKVSVSVEGPDVAGWLKNVSDRRFLGCSWGVIIDMSILINCVLIEWWTEVDIGESKESKEPVLIPTILGAQEPDTASPPCKVDINLWWFLSFVSCLIVDFLWVARSYYQVEQKLNPFASFSVCVYIYICTYTSYIYIYIYLQYTYDILIDMYIWEAFVDFLMRQIWSYACNCRLEHLTPWLHPIIWGHHL